VLSCVGEELSVAVIVNMADPDWAERVPVIAPVLVLKLSTAGSDGEIEYVIGETPPAAVTGVNEVTAVPASMVFVAMATDALSGA
jgi:hypothetical protein